MKTSSQKLGRTPNITPQTSIMADDLVAVDIVAYVHRIWGEEHAEEILSGEYLAAGEKGLEAIQRRFANSARQPQGDNIVRSVLPTDLTPEAQAILRRDYLEFATSTLHVPAGLVAWNNCVTRLGTMDIPEDHPMRRKAEDNSHYKETLKSRGVQEKEFGDLLLPVAKEGLDDAITYIANTPFALDPKNAPEDITDFHGSYWDAYLYLLENGAFPRFTVTPTATIGRDASGRPNVIDYNSRFNLGAWVKDKTWSRATIPDSVHRHAQAELAKYTDPAVIRDGVDTLIGYDITLGHEITDRFSDVLWRDINASATGGVLPLSTLKEKVISTVEKYEDEGHPELVVGLKERLVAHIGDLISQAATEYAGEDEFLQYLLDLEEFADSLGVALPANYQRMIENYAVSRGAAISDMRSGVTSHSRGEQRRILTDSTGQQTMHTQFPGEAQIGDTQRVGSTIPHYMYDILGEVLGQYLDATDTSIWKWARDSSAIADSVSYLETEASKIGIPSSWVWPIVTSIVAYTDSGVDAVGDAPGKSKYIPSEPISETPDARKLVSPETRSWRNKLKWSDTRPSKEMLKLGRFEDDSNISPAILDKHYRKVFGNAPKPSSFATFLEMQRFVREHYNYFTSSYGLNQNMGWDDVFKLKAKTEEGHPIIPEIPGIYSHDLTDTWIRWAQRRGVDPHTIAAVLDKFNERPSNNDPIAAMGGMYNVGWLREIEQATSGQGNMRMPRVTSEKSKDAIQFLNDLMARIKAMSAGRPTMANPYPAWEEWHTYALAHGFTEVEAEMGARFLEAFLMTKQDRNDPLFIDFRNTAPSLTNAAEYKQLQRAGIGLTPEQEQTYESLMRYAAIAQASAKVHPKVIFHSVYEVADWLRTGDPQTYKSYYPEAIDTAKRILQGKTPVSVVPSEETASAPEATPGETTEAVPELTQKRDWRKRLRW